MIAIKGFEMPRGCCNCCFVHSCDDDYCIPGKFSVYWNDKKRPDNCPLVEIKEVGE